MRRSSSGSALRQSVFIWEFFAQRRSDAPAAAAGFTIETRVDKQINAPVCCIVAFVDRRQSQSAPVCINRSTTGMHGEALRSTLVAVLSKTAPRFESYAMFFCFVTLLAV